MHHQVKYCLILNDDEREKLAVKKSLTITVNSKHQFIFSDYDSIIDNTNNFYTLQASHIKGQKVIPNNLLLMVLLVYYVSMHSKFRYISIQTGASISGES